LKNALLTYTGTSEAMTVSEGDNLQVVDTGVQAMTTVLAKSTDLCRSQYTEAPYDAEGTAAQLCRRFGSHRCPLTGKNLVVLKSLLSWRDRLARSLDESVHFIAPDACLWRVALALPSSAARLRSTCNPLPAMLQAHAQEVVDLLSDAPMQPSTSSGTSGGSGGGRQANTSTTSTSVGAVTQVAPSRASFAQPVLPKNWPERKKRATRPVVHVAAAADSEGANRLDHLKGAMSSLLGMLTTWAEDKALCLGDAPKLEATSAKLRSIQDAMTFTAAPPEPAEGTWSFDKGNPVEAVVEEEALPPAVPEVQPEDLPPLRKRKRARNTAGKKDLESYVKHMPAIADVYGGLAVSDPYTVPTPAATKEAEDGPLAEQPKKKKKKGKKGAAAARTELDPYF